MGSSLTVLGYRLAMILSGGIAFIWVDPRQGGGWTWPEVYRVMALLHGRRGGVLGAARAAPGPRREAGERRPQRPARLSRRRRRGRGRLRRDALRVRRRWARALVVPLFAGSSIAPSLAERWVDLVALFAGIGVTLPLVAWAARRARFETLLGSLRQLLRAGRRAAVPRLHRPLQARRRLRRVAADAVPAPGDALQHRRGRRRQQGDRPVADDRRRAGRRRAHDPARPVALADAVRHPADARQPRLLVARAARPRRAARARASRRSTGASSSSPRRRRSTAAC